MTERPRYPSKSSTAIRVPACAGGSPGRTGQTSVHHHASDALALVHHVEAAVDLFKRQGVGDHRVDLNLLFHVPVDDLGDVAAAARAAKGSAFPSPAGDELERPRRDLLPCAR